MVPSSREASSPTRSSAVPSHHATSPAARRIASPGVGSGGAKGVAAGEAPADAGVSWGEAPLLLELGGAGTLARRAVTSSASPTSATVTMRTGLNARLWVRTMPLGYPPMTDPSTAAPRWIVHPTLLAAAFVLEVALANQVEPPGFIRSLAVAVVAA